MTKTGKGAMLIFMPWIMIMVVLSVWAIASFVIGMRLSSGVDVSEGMLIGMRILNIVLGFLGILSLLGIPVGLVWGIVVITRREEVTTTETTSAPPTQSNN